LRRYLHFAGCYKSLTSERTVEGANAN
jgi:hypothetical protein